MPRKPQEINVTIHMPEDKRAAEELQEKTNTLFCHIVEKKFRNAGLTAEERSCVVNRIVEDLKRRDT